MALAVENLEKNNNYLEREIYNDYIIHIKIVNFMFLCEFDLIDVKKGRLIIQDIES